MVLDNDVSRDVFLKTAETGVLIEIDTATYRYYETAEDIARYPYELLFVDETKRVCAFAHLLGDEQIHPYLGFWTEAGRFYCKRLVDRLVYPENGGDPYLPPLGLIAETPSSALSPLIA